MWLAGSRGGSRAMKVTRAVTSERPFLLIRWGVSGDLSSFPGFTCSYGPPAGTELFLGRRSSCLSLSCPGWQLLRGIMPGAAHEKC